MIVSQASEHLATPIMAALLLTAVTALFAAYPSLAQSDSTPP